MDFSQTTIWDSLTPLDRRSRFDSAVGYARGFIDGHAKYHSLAPDAREGLRDAIAERIFIHLTNSGDMRQSAIRMMLEDIYEHLP